MKLDEIYALMEAAPSPDLTFVDKLTTEQKQHLLNQINLILGTNNATP